MGIDTLKQNIKQAKGLYQGIDDNLLHMSYSPDCQNIDVSDGIISTRSGSVAKSIYTSSTTLPYPCKKIINVPVEQGGAFFYAPVYGCVNGSTYIWYYAEEVEAGWSTALVEITELSAVNPVTCDSLQYMISGVPYEIIFSTTDVIKLSGVLNGHGYVGITAADLGGTPPKGMYCTLHRERVWVAGVAANLNYTHYSNSYDPQDWSTSGETGHIEIVTHDADAIIGIANLMDDVIVFKGNTAWKISGDTPSEYSVSQIYSTRGTISDKSIVTDGLNCFFASSDGIYSYDGTSCEPILTNEIKDIFAAMQSVKCTIYKDKLYVWDIYQTSGYVGKHITYDIVKKQIEVIYGGTVYDADGITYSTGTKIYTLGSGNLTLSGSAIAAYWITPESDLGYPNAEKTLTDLALTAWGTTGAGASGGQLKVTIYFNRNGTARTKEITLTLTSTRRTFTKTPNITGRLFKFKFENVSGSMINLTGFEAKYEIDEG